MAIYDFTLIRWSSKCDTNEIINDGFENRLYFNEDLSAPIYEIDELAKKSEGSNISERRIWTKKYTITANVLEAVADIITQMGLADNITIVDKNGNFYSTSGDNVEIDVKQAGEYLFEKVYYPVLEVKLTFNAEQIKKTQCCMTLATEITCSGEKPLITTFTAGSPTTVNLKGTASTGHFVRIYRKKLIEDVAVAAEPANVLHLTRTTAVYTTRNPFRIYNTVDGGKTWALYDDLGGGIEATGDIDTNLLYYPTDGSLFFKLLDSDSNVRLYKYVISTKTLTDVSGVIINFNEDLKLKVDINHTILLLRSNVLSRFNILTNVLTDITPPAAATKMRRCEFGANTISFMIAGENYIAYTQTAGVTWTETTPALGVVISIKYISGTTWYLGSLTGRLHISTDNGVNWTTTNLSSLVTSIDKIGITKNGRAYLVNYANKKMIFQNPITSLWTEIYSWSPDVGLCSSFFNDANDFVCLIGCNNQKINTTEADFAVLKEGTADLFGTDGFDTIKVANTTYVYKPETFLHGTDPCTEGSETII
jgi:hypothetical protein